MKSEKAGEVVSKSSEASVVHEKKNKILSLMRANPWIVSTAFLAIILLVVLMFSGSGEVSSSTIGNKAVSFINDQLLAGKGKVVLDSVSEKNGLYEVTVDYNGNRVPTYFTKDAKFFVGDPSVLISLTGNAVSDGSSNSKASAVVPKSDKPKVELFVMSFCPYGVKAENNILPVIKLLGNAIDFKVRYIVNVGGSKIEDVSSLHGLFEAKENARQLIIARDYPSKFLSYLEQFNAKCYSIGDDKNKLDTCWKGIASGLGMSSTKIESAAYGSDGVNLLKAESTASNGYGVSGSPTLVINGVVSSSIYSGTEAVQAAICGAFNDIPASCGTKVVSSDTSSAPAGSCG